MFLPAAIVYNLTANYRPGTRIPVFFFKLFMRMSGCKGKNVEVLSSRLEIGEGW